MRGGLAGGWKSGDKRRVVEVVAPFGGTEEMLEDLGAKVFKNREVKFRALEGGKSVVRIMRPYAIRASQECFSACGTMRRWSPP